MSEVNLWKITEAIERMSDNLEDINDYLDQVHDTNMAFNQWIQAATESLTEMRRDINYLKNKKDCI